MTNYKFYILKRQLKNNFALIYILLLTGCGIYTNTYFSYDKNIDFTKYKTFAWLPDSGMTAKKDSFRNSAYDNDIIRNNAKNYIVHDLGKRGFRIQVNDPDVLIQLVLQNEKKQVIRDFPFYYSPYYYYNRFYYPYYYPYYDYYTYYGWGCLNGYCNNYPASKQTYVKGTITLHMFDRRLKKLVWTGSAEGNIYDTSYIQNDVHPAIHRIMKKFPLRPISHSKGNKIN
ncbi:MAG TPA: DUF4136 domain-containing protein [Bacteroidia bacterium]|nr:DUF4136 domain-containing protein [Bacteroidia bacterium]